ncbi:MAG: glycoside hydrolase family 28 protein [bacterium]
MNPAQKSHYYSVSHDGNPVFTEVISKFDVPVHVARFVHFGPSRIRVEVPRDIESFYVGPESRAIDAEVRDGGIEFPLPLAGNYVVRVNELGYLFLFADQDERLNFPELATRARRIEEFGVPADDAVVRTEQIQSAIDAVSIDPNSDLLVFSSGCYLTGTLQLRSDVTLFLEEHAWLIGSDDPAHFPDQSESFHEGEWSYARSFLVAHGVENAGIAGNGIVDGNGKSLKLQGLKANLLLIRDCRNISVFGVQLRDPSGWNTHVFASDSVAMRAVKIINNVPSVNWTNTDGIDPDCSRNVTIESSFLYCGDDCFAIKGKSRTPSFARNTEHILVRGSVCISACAALKIGTETVADWIHDVVFEDNDVVFARRALVIEAFDRSLVSSVVFRNTRVEVLNDGPGIERPLLVDFEIPSTAFRPCEGAAVVRDIRVEELTLRTPVSSKILGRTPENRVDGVTIDGLTIAGRRVRDLREALIQTNEYVNDLVLK